MLAAGCDVPAVVDAALVGVTRGAARSMAELSVHLPVRPVRNLGGTLKRASRCSTLSLDNDIVMGLSTVKQRRNSFTQLTA